MAGRIYNEAAYSQLESYLQFQENQFKGIDQEKEVTNKKIMQFGIVLVGSIVILLGLKLIVKKR